MRTSVVSFDEIKTGTKSFGLVARLTFKWFQEKPCNEPSLITSWIDQKGTEFRGRIAYNDNARRLHHSLEMDQIYRLIGIDKFYIWKDDSRMLSIKDISINNESEISQVDRNEAIYSSFPQLTYAYQDFLLHRNQLTPETRLNIDVLGVFKRWVTTNEDMEIMTTNYEKLIIDVGNAIEQIGLVVRLQECQTLISIKGVRVELVEYTGALSYRCFNDSILTVGNNCPESPEKEKTSAWIEHNNECCDEAVSEP